MSTQFYSALNYLNTHHDFVPVNNQPPVSDAQVTPDTPEQFAGTPASNPFLPRALMLAAKQELARDLILKTKEIDLLVGSLPGIGVSEEQQIERLERLEGELQDVERKRREVVARKEALQKRLDEVIQTVAVNSKARS
jgi:mediator of RNA polymerase II transcription subunit 21